MNIIDRQRIANLGRNHYSDAEIAKRVGISPNEVAAVRAELGIASHYVELPPRKSVDQLSAILTDALLPSKILGVLSAFVDNQAAERSLGVPLRNMFGYSTLGQTPTAIIPPRRIQVKGDMSSVPEPPKNGVKAKPGVKANDDRPMSLRAIDAMAVEGLSVAKAGKRFKVSTPAIYAMMKKLREAGKLDKRIKLQPRSSKKAASPKKVTQHEVEVKKRVAKRQSAEVMKKAVAIAKAELKKEAASKKVAKPTKGKAPVKAKAPTKAPTKTSKKVTKPATAKKAQPKPTLAPASWETHI